MRKLKGIIRIDNFTFDDNSDLSKNPLPKINGFSVDFEGHNEGSASPCANQEEVDKQIKSIIESKKEYELKIIDERIKQNSLLLENASNVNTEKNTYQEHNISQDEYIPQGIDTEVEKPKTPEELVKERTIELLDKQVRKLQGECWAIQGYFESFLQRGKNKEKNPYYLQKIAEYGFDVSDLNKLKELFEQKAKLYKMCYEKAHFLRWGTNGSEYAYV